MLIITSILYASLLGFAQEAMSGEEMSAPKPDVKVEIQNLTSIRGVRKNQIFGLGLVVGLNGSGDSQEGTKQAISNMLRKLELNVSQSDVNSGNIALVMVTATLEPFVQNGAQIDVTVSTVGDAKSLQGGFLTLTPLKGADGEVYAVAQGNISIGGGYQAEGEAASATKGHPTVGRIPNGAIVEKNVPMTMINEIGIMKLDLRYPEFLTAQRIAEAINAGFPGTAAAKNAGEVWVNLPQDVANTDQIVPFIAMINQFEVLPDVPAKIVINERTGTIVAGHEVKIFPAAIAHGPLEITIAETPQVSQPGPFSEGETTTVPRTTLTVNEVRGKAREFSEVVSVIDLVKGLNDLRATPRDIIAILQLLKEGGQLQAELIIM